MRQWTTYELNQLVKHGFDTDKLEQYGEKPVEYITGWAPFLADDFKVNPKVLIPREETGELVELAFSLVSKKKKLIVADIGCGSGCVGVSLAKMLSQKWIDMTLFLSDISRDALELAKENARRILPDYERIVFLESDLLSDFPRDVKFDLIVANLPYIPSPRLAHLAKSVIGFEPVMALDGGPDGLGPVKKLLDQAPGYLEREGIIVFEVDETHTLSDFGKFAEIFELEVRKDSLGKNRFLTARLVA